MTPTNDPEVLARARAIAARAAIPLAQALPDAAVEIGYERAQAAQAAAAKAERENPRPAFNFDRFDTEKAREEQRWRAIADPQLVQLRSARRSQIEREIASINAAIEQHNAPLLARRRALADELSKL